MTERRTVRGLFDFIEAQADGVEMDFSSIEFPPGLGWGASEDARRWALAGYREEHQINPETTMSKGGRPRKQRQSLEEVDEQRAFSLWWFIHGLAVKPRGTARNFSKPVKIKTRHAIELIQNVPDAKALFPIIGEHTLEQSVSRGKKKLGIDRGWLSETCEKLADGFQQ